MFNETYCSICGKELRGTQGFKESRVGIFSPVVPVVKDGEVTCFAMGINRFALCKSCTQSLYSWIKNRRKKKQAENREKIKKILESAPESSFVYPDNSGPHDAVVMKKALMTNA